MSVIKKKIVLVLALTFFGLNLSLLPNILASESDANDIDSITEEDSTMDTLFDRYFDTAFFSDFRDPFHEMQRLRRDLMKALIREPDGKVFDSWYKRRFGGESPQEIKQMEDAESICYEITIGDLGNNKIDVKVADKNVTITGKTERTSQTKTGQSRSLSHFRRIFPVPAGVDEKNFKVEEKDKKIVVRFPKK